MTNYLPLKLTTNSIAFCADSMPAVCSKGLKNRIQTSESRSNHRKHKPNQHVAVIDVAEIATEFVVAGV